MYKPEPRMLNAEDMSPIAYTEFIPKLKNLAISHFGLEQRLMLPARSVCSDESEAQVIYTLASYFGSNPFDFGRVGGLIARDRTPAAAHHGKDIVIVAATHVGYDPSKEKLEDRFGHIYRPQMGLPQEDPHSYSTCCGKLAGTTEPFQMIYELAATKKINLVKKVIDSETKYCITINNHLLDQHPEEGVVLNLHLEKMVKQVNGAPVKFTGRYARANSTVFEVSDWFKDYLGSDLESHFEGMEKAHPIGKMLGPELFDFEQSRINEKEDGSQLILKNLLPYMNRIVSNQIPSLAAANVTMADEFSETVTAMRTNAKGLDILTNRVLFIAGINLDVYDKKLAQQNPLLGHQVYFVPYAAYFRTPEDPYGKVFEMEEISELLVKQSETADHVSLDEVVLTNPTPLILKGY